MSSLKHDHGMKLPTSRKVHKRIDCAEIELNRYFVTHIILVPDPCVALPILYNCISFLSAYWLINISENDFIS